MLAERIDLDQVGVLQRRQDGGFGAESIPEEIETSGDLLEIAKILRERGYEESAIEAVMGGNMLRKLRESLTK